MKKFLIASSILASLALLVATPGFTRKKEMSLRDLQQLAQREPKNSQVQYMLGLKYEIDGFPQKATQAYQQAVSLKADYPEALYRLGEVKGLQGDQEGAIKALTKAIKLKPDYKEAKVTLGTIYGQQGAAFLGQGDWANAAQVLQEAVANNPDDDAAYNNLGVAYAGQGDWDKATQSFQAAIAVNPINDSAHFNLGYTYLRQGNKSGALDQYSNLSSLGSGNAGDLFGLMSFPKGWPVDTPYETPQFGETSMKPSLPSSVAPSQATLADALRDAPDMQVPIMDSALPPGPLEEPTPPWRQPKKWSPQ
jgi:tetratricopeptide (TPR) repeat protein